MCQLICLFTSLSPLFHFPRKLGEVTDKRVVQTSTNINYILVFSKWHGRRSCSVPLSITCGSSDTPVSHFDKTWRNDASHLFRKKNYTTWPKEEAAITAQKTVTCLLLIVPHLWGRRHAHCRFASALSPGLLPPSPLLTPWQPGIPPRHPSPHSLTLP